MEGEPLALGFTGPELVVGGLAIGATVLALRWAYNKATK